MATKKKNTYIGQDLEWLENKAAALRKFCDDNPIPDLRDRIVGGKVVSKIEEQIKCIRDTMKDYIEIMAAIDELREKKEVTKTTARGNQELSPFETKDI
jgi:hypothetical protein